ncbi:TetR/AcrR family transcriptional regulator [Ornithinibacillus sp. BX22]|uniref:TetR/AcrR family transcriptional regulator n=1 Tax=Ornithinibacillus hominis TaxID=2763055 RepID=A0A923L867_9BACI|nr:TetR/AcrR family transcriptional regulator [Ornithinibacillus hominis]MBC5638310.1 TetR/AcrR family transcriptional regulator [Ornithinibacillus hominis]
MSRSTKDKIIEAAVELISEKGYKGATTREIAERAAVNEVTLFRHFGNKKGIVEAAIQKYAFVDLLENTLEEKMTWELEQDLKMLVREYQSLLEKKKPVILLSIKESSEFPELDELIKHIPQKYIDLLENYFTKMMELGKIKRVDPSIIATNFVFINFGYSLMRTRINPGKKEYSIDDFIEKNIEFFIQSLQ